jgi:hypothetical protein
MRFEVFQDDDGGWRWRFRDADDKVVATSEDAEYSDLEAKKRLVEFKRQVSAAPDPQWEPDDGEQ